MMAPSVYLCSRILILLSHLLPLLWATQGCVHEHLPNCPSSFDCGYLGKIHFPYTTTQHTDCGLLQINGCNNPRATKTILTKGRTPFEFEVISVTTESTILLRDLDLHERLRNKSCEAFSKNYTLPPPLSSSFNIIRNNGVLFRCNRNRTLHVMTPPDDARFFTYPCGDDYDILYGYSSAYSNNSERHRLLLSENCSVIYFPMKDLPDNSDPFTFVTSEIVLRLSDDECSECYRKRTGHCRFVGNQTFYCHRDGMSRGLKMGLGLGLGFGIGLPVIVIIGWLIGRHCKRKYYSSNDQLESREMYSDTYSNPDPENGSIYFGVPLFSYKELKEATNNFDHTRVLGDGGFGIVYYGKLRDGREVAVKQLYEHNFRRVEQFRNEVKILANLRHKNLVSLYGCTSRQSRDLLLVYEYISNGTVSSHLHHSSSSSPLHHAPLPLSWPTRLKIAIETASALAYLHASDIIHRDVKTNNILLDANFTVKVADFGLSRMFPNDASHVSTAPQGTPGYVDPEYYQCYQLTSKSDVYSFGVVLMELVSSKAAVDMSRSKEEVNLSNLAVRKIQESAFGELVDPRLGMERDGEVRRMVVSVGELAFQCLQRDRDLRPSMDEVLEALKRIEIGSGGKVDVEDLEAGEGNVSTVTPAATPPPPSPPPMSPDWEEVGLLKKMKARPNSPNSVTDKWKSEATTPNVSH
ncbi:LEAF RUST 10 DISEASE-RESISTANCE LOCUS RECEPTOR-LIKE PROTEIN KINASE-like 1.1 [Senna tora]|uniref:LEAF RUST 10 DISEASE-RESISTANCE LOCUS RECEPTOR-LIKE PROTEIN KINASE-like 1.1 n=1 Tax=Senna tora TaxID=362788 RepID=A0A834W526_9FABA|nr:LEAF RUST 10 DISEASE-RESISTANCE LOCUS RECEPTOR-LIKE PROTEIN KINASE-like 1.1 [Senna tora]